MATYQHLNNDIAGVIPTPAKMVEAEIAINTTDQKIFTKNKTGQVVQIGYSQAELDKKFSDSATDAGKKFLATGNRLSELSSGNLSLVKTANDNLGSVIAKPITLDQAKGTGANITRMDDPRLTEMNQTWTINATMEDSPAGVVVNAAILINTRRAFAAGASISQTLINAGGINYIRTGTGSAGNFTWNGVTQGQKDPNGWRKVFDSVVLPTLAELGAAKSGVNTDITQLGVNSAATPLKILGNAEISSALKVNQVNSNYRMTVFRDDAFAPYIWMGRNDQVMGILPESEVSIFNLSAKAAPASGNDPYAGVALGSMAVNRLTDGSGKMFLDTRLENNTIRARMTMDAREALTHVDRGSFKVSGNTETSGISNTGLITSSGGITVTGAGASNVILGSGTADVYLTNTVSNKVLQLKDNGVLAYSDQPIYHAGNKPTAQDVGALPLTGGTVSGQTAFNNALYVNPDYGVTFNIGTVQNRILAPLDGIIRVNTQGRVFADFDGRLVKGAGSLKIEGATWAKNNPKGYAEQYGIPGVVDVNFSDTAEGYLPAFKARSTVTGRGYNTQVSIGLLREGGNAWGKMALFVASDEGGTSAHPRAVATLDTSGNFNSNILSSNYLTVNGSIDAVNAITSQQNINALGSVNARAGITSNGTLFMASNNRRHIQFANGDISKTDGYIFKDWAGPMQILASDGGSVSSTYSFHPSGYFEAAKIKSGGQIETGSGQATFSASGDSYGPTWNNGWLSSLLASHGISDKSVKTNIKDATRDPMEVIDKIRFVEFDWTEDMMKYKNSETVKNGFISQDLNEIDPSLVQESLGKLQMDTSSIIPLSLNAIQQLNKRVKELEEKLEALSPSIPEPETVEIKTVKKSKAK